MGRALVVILVVVTAVLGATIGYFNAQPVVFNYLIGEAELPLIALIMGELAVVVILALLVCAGRMFALRGEIGRLRKQLRDAEAELKNLRNLPLKDV